MPPVMGAAAFLMAEFLNIPYGQIALAAAIPAVLYYLALFTQIDLEAAKRGLLGLPANEIPKFRSVIRLGWVFLIPLSILVYTLMIENWEAGKAGMVAVIGVLAVGALQKETRPSFKKIRRGFRRDRQNSARHRRDHGARRHRHRRAPSFRLHFQNLSAAGHAFRQ